MAGNLNGGGDDSGGMITEMNVVPLVDIILVVLVIFMLTANLIARPSIPVELPEASTGDAGEPTTIAITVTKDGSMYLNGAPTDEAGLKAFIPDVVKNDPKAQAIIAADKEVAHGKVIHLIDLIRQLGLYKFALNVDPSADTP
ncbi:MAG: biopolymer transporter ExbD [Clostridia bacterium]|nr:biopolymer transporter ExbD [Deltaproteobacteria bacterium]